MTQKKKRYLLLPVLVCAVAGAVGALAACGEEHTHTKSDGWAFDKTAHWHPSTCGHDVKSDKALHSYTAVVSPAGYTTYTCACGYSYRDDEEGTSPSAKWDFQFNEDSHWHGVIGAGSTIDYIAHSYTDSVVAPTCSKQGYTLHTCNDCGYWFADNLQDALGHTFHNGAWHADEQGHYQLADCCGEAKSAYTAHDFAEVVTPPTHDTQGYTTFTCKDCQYSYTGRTVAAGHAYSTDYAYDENQHWHAPVCGCDVDDVTLRADVADHVIEGRSPVCVICNKQVTPYLEYELSADGNSYIVKGIGCAETTFTVPETYRGKPVSKIEAGAFANTNLVSITIPASVTVDNWNGMFKDCKDLTSFTYNGTFTKIANYMFEDCEKLSSVSFSGTVTEIGYGAFAGCAALTTAGLDISACTKIGFAAFADCALFAPAALPTGLTDLGEYAFSGSKITGITLPATLNIGARAFEDCTSLTSATVELAEITESLFEGCTTLSNVTLTNTVRVGANAFNGCTALNALTLPASLTSVGAGAFTATGLVSTVGSVKYAAGIAIDGKAAVGAVTLESGTVGIADGAFYKNASLSSVTFANDLRFIGADAFRNCTGINSVDFKSVTRIGANAFRNSGLTSVNIPASVLSVGDNAFYDCAALLSVEVHAAAIGNFAFSYTGTPRGLDNPVKGRPDTAHLTSVTLGSEVVSIGSNAFRYCPIATIGLPAALQSIGQYAFAQTDLTSIEIPASVAFIGEYAFYECNLTGATFGEASGWKAGKTAVAESVLNNAASAAEGLTATYCDVDWTREEQA